MVLRVETPVIYWVRMQTMDTSKLYQRLVLGMARYYAKSDSRKQLEVLEKGKLVAAAGDDGVYKRARLERLVYRVKGQVQELEKVEVFNVDYGEREFVKPVDVCSLPQHLGVEMFPPVVVRVVVSGIMPRDRDWDR